MSAIFQVLEMLRLLIHYSIEKKLYLLKNRQSNNLFISFNYNVVITLSFSLTCTLDNEHKKPFIKVLKRLKKVKARKKLFVENAGRLACYDL